jgi:hypothetical protein
MAREHMTSDEGFVVEDRPEGRTLVVTGRWTEEAEAVLDRPDVDGLSLNYARGFCEPDLGFVKDWSIRRLRVLDHKLTDLTPLARLSATLEDLSVQAAPDAELDLSAFSHLQHIGCEWELIRPSLGRVDDLRSVITWEFGDVDLHSFRDHVALQRLTIKHGPYLDSLSGIGDLPALEVLKIMGARRLCDVSDVDGLAASLRRLELEDCRPISALDDVEGLVELRFLGVNDCGEVASLAPVASLRNLEKLYAWGSTRVVDGDLSPLASLPMLSELRMRERRDYRPRVSEIKAAFS